MEIHNKHTDKKNLKSSGTIFTKRTVFSFIALSVSLVCFAGLFMVYGAYLYKTEQLFHEIFFVKDIVKKDFSFVNKSIESSIVDIDKIDIDIKFVDYERLRYYREKALSNNEWCPECKSEVPAEIVYNGEKYKVGVSLNGQVFSHIYHPTKWSFAIKVKGGKTIKGVKKFALLVPLSRGYLTDWIGHKVVETRRVIGLRNDFIDVAVNGVGFGVYYFEERYDKLLIENNSLREGVVFRIEGNEISPYNKKKIYGSTDMTAQLVNLKSSWNAFLNGEVKSEQLFDLQKMASAVAVSDLMNQKHTLKIDNIRFYYNSSTNLIEPIIREFEFMVKDDKVHFHKLFIEKPTPGYSYPEVHHREVLASHVNKILDNDKFEELYLQELQVISQKTYLDSVFAINKNELDLLLDKLYKENPFYDFPKEVLYANQKAIASKINIINPALKVVFKESNQDSILFEVENRIELPLELKGLTYGSKRLNFGTKIKIDSKHKIEGVQHVSVSNLNFLKEGFLLDSLRVEYSLLGLDQSMEGSFLPEEIKRKVHVNPVTQPSNITEFDFLIIDSKAKTIRFKSGLCSIKKDLVVPKGYTLSASSGCKINISDSARIISYSPLVFFGSKDQPIIITSEDSTGQGIVVYNASKMSQLSHVEVHNLKNIVDFGWNLKGALTFYESPVTIENCLFKDNKRGDDYLNVIRTNFTIKNTVFQNTLADAFDSDFCQGTLQNVNFIEVGNDAIDVSGTKLFAENIKIINPEDKGISGGEGAHLIFKNVTIKGGEIGVASKDNSVVDVSGLIIQSTKLAYCAFQKKPEYGPGVIKILKDSLKEVPNKYLIEVGSTLIIDGNSIEDKTKDVNTMLYGGEFGKKS